jgi:hypothetical protein
MLIKQNKNVITLLLLLVIVIGCQKNKKVKEQIIAEVGDTKLTETQLNSYLGGKNNNVEFRNEFIRQWIETEILYQIAEEKGIVKNTNFKNIMKQSKKKLAASLTIKDYVTRNTHKYGNSELLEYYKENKNNFLLSTDAYILNYISFLTEEEAINFRNKAIAKGWQKAEQEIVNKDDVVRNYQDKLIKISQIPSKRILRVLKEQYRNEISLVVRTELNNFVVVQQTEKIKRNSIPKFRYIKKEVEAMYIASKNKELARSYINKLITEKQVKIY